MVDAGDKLKAPFLVTALERRLRFEPPFAVRIIVRLSLVLLLLFAAASKTYEVTTDRSAENSATGSLPFWILAVELQLLLAVCLSTTFVQRQVWATAFGVFVVFAAVSFWKSIQGRSHVAALVMSSLIPG